MLFAVSGHPIPALAGTNFFLFPDAESSSGLGTKSLEETPLYLTAAYPDGRRSPGGFIGISPALYAQTGRWEASTPGNRPDDYRRFKQDMVERMHRQIERFCPELAGHPSTWKARPP